MRKWTVLIDWEDGDVSDTDEMTIRAETEVEALIMVLSEWAAKTLLEWPSCTIQSISVLRAKRLRPLA